MPKFVAPSGVTLDVDPSDPVRLRAAAALGYRPETPDEEQARLAREAEGTPLAVAQTVGESALSSATLGLSDVAARALAPGYADRMGLRREENPIGAGLGTALGVVAPLIATGGASAAAKGGASALGTGLRVLGAPTLATTRLAEAGGGLALEGLGRLGVTGAGLTGSALRGATKLGVTGVIEGAVQGAGIGISEAALAPGGDFDHLGERVLAGARNGALFGGLLGTGLGTLGGVAGFGLRRLGEGARGLLTRAADTAERIGEAAPSADQLAEAGNTVAGIVTSGDEELIRRAGVFNLSSEGRTLRREIQAAPEKRQILSRELRESVTQLNEDTQAVFREGMGDAKIRNVDKLLDPRSRPTQLRAAFEEIDRIDAAYKNLDPAGFTEITKDHQEVARLIRRTRDEMQAIKDPAEAFRTIDTVKRRLQQYADDLSPYGKAPPPGVKIDQFRRLSDGIEAIQESTRQFLERQDVWGRAALAQADMNANWTRMLNGDRRRFFDLFTTPGNRTYRGGVLREADAGKIDSAVQSLGKARGDDVERVLRGYSDQASALADAMQRHLEGVDPARVARIRDTVTRINRVLDDSMSTIRLAERAQEQLARESGAGATVGAIIGSPLGPLGSAVGSAIGGLVSSPLRSGLALERGIVAAEKLGQRFAGVRPAHDAIVQIGSATSRTNNRMARSIGSLFSSTRTAARQTTIREGVEAESVADRTFRRRAHEDQGQAFDRFVRKLGEVEAQAKASVDRPDPQAPEASKAVAQKVLAGVAYLKANLPAGVGGDDLLPGVKRPAPDQLSLMRFARKAQVVNDPLSVIEEMKQGTLTPDHVDALKSVYPRLYSEIREKVAARLADRTTPIPQNDRQSLRLLFDLVDGKKVAAAQATYQNQPAPQSPTRGRAPQTSKLNTTQAERLGIY